MEAVTISAIEYEIIERAFEEGWVKPKKGKPSGKTAAVIGSGPAGLSAAHYLYALGHDVTVYERNDRPGGLLMYGIPNMKLDKNVVLRRIDVLKEAGVKFVLGTEVGKDIPAAEIAVKYDVVIVCTGATKPRGLNVPGSDFKGIHFAVDFLKANTKSLLDSNLTDGKNISAEGKDVIIIGGGDTGTDCVATSLRHGCKSVCQFEIMPKSADVRNPVTNPWPEWPKVIKTDYGQKESLAVYGEDPRNYLISTKRFFGDEYGNV